MDGCMEHMDVLTGRGLLSPVLPIRNAFSLMGEFIVTIRFDTFGNRSRMGQPILGGSTGMTLAKDS